LATANANPAGEIESIANLVLPAAGTYYVRVTSADDTIQLYELSLAPTPILVGDYNRNGVVDADDYAVWRKSVGQAVAIGTGADGNFDGQVTQSDYMVWKSHFGQTGGSGIGTDLGAGATVPEPSTVLLTAIIFSMVGATSGRRGKRDRLGHFAL
jgi:serralysin